MQKLNPNDPETMSADIVSENLTQLKALFPEAFVEGKVDFDVLKQLLGGAVDEREEKYGLNWHGKRKARQLALTPSIGTLRPCPEESVDWETTQNLMIEGDNLEVLKLLEKSYAGKVRLIYIDPPYNTGKDFVYPDNFHNSISHYLELTRQADGGVRVTSNTEASGRFHTDWLNMMYPRMKLAKQLLADDGVIFISIDDGELATMRLLCDDIFGEENFVANIIWQKKYSPQNDAKWLSDMHDYVLLYARNKEAWRPTSLPRTEEQDAAYQNPDDDPRGPWKATDSTCNKSRSQRPNLYYPMVNPVSGDEVYPSESRVWRYAREVYEEKAADNRIWWGHDGTNKVPAFKSFLSEVKQGRVPTTLWSYQVAGHNQSARQELNGLIEGNTFDTPKPSQLIKLMLQIGTSPGTSDIVLDFFAGSGTTGQAVMEQNEIDQGDRRFILVQLPESIGDGRFSTISALTAERLRRAAQSIKNKSPMFSGDLGFRFLRLDSSNIAPWDPESKHLDESLLAAVSNIKESRAEADILYELLLKLGLDLCVPIEVREISGKAVHSVGAGALMICLAPQIDRSEVESLALGIVEWHKELDPASESSMVFLDSAFADDVSKTNMTAILGQHGLLKVRSL